MQPWARSEPVGPNTESRRAGCESWLWGIPYRLPGLHPGGARTGELLICTSVREIESVEQSHPFAVTEPQGLTG
jgi:hypothetical protein